MNLPDDTTEEESELVLLFRALFSRDRSDDPDGTHRHKCELCHTVWEHSNKCNGNAKAHQCPTCGEEEYWHYTGSCKVSELPILSPKDDANEA